MQYFLNLPSDFFDKPAAWAKEMQRQGWSGICASDHILVGSNPYPHVFATTAAMAAATDQILITTSFANNLFRSPVEFAQAAMTLQMLSNGRFEAGIGAGWAEHEMLAMGLEYPDPSVRVSMYIEALTVVRALLKHKSLIRLWRGQRGAEKHHRKISARSMTTTLHRYIAESLYDAGECAYPDSLRTGPDYYLTLSIPPEHKANCPYPDRQ